MKNIFKGILGALSLLGIFLIVAGLISGLEFTVEQFLKYWYYIIALAIGFGVQIGLYSYLRQLIKEKASGRILAATGASSTLAMISCCAHYLANILPIVGIGGFISLVAQYQIQLFWLGIVFNLAGIIFIYSRLRLFLKGAA